MEKLETLRRRHPVFFYKSYSYILSKKDLHLSFHFFVFPNINFYPKVVLKNVSLKAVDRIGEKTLKNLVFHIGLMEIPSYWKATCSPRIVVEAGALTKEQKAWWKDLLIQGLGEFFYKNNIDFTQKNFIRLESLPRKGSSLARLSYPHLNRVKDVDSKVLVPVGGGKDAIITLEVLKKAKREILPFVLNPSSVHKKLLAKAGYKKFISAQRTIDPKLLDLNNKGYLNGHTPFSAYLAFLTALLAVLFNTKYVFASNERSSNEGNALYKRRVINHQYSKTFEFERKFRSYSKKYLAPSLEYVSFLRPLYELQIAQLFSKYPKYSKTFLSCNSKNRKWCGVCAKCLFVFTALYPFLKENQLVSIFKKNLFQDAMLVSLLEELTGEREIKPFECVGTRKETLAALFLSLSKQKGKLPILLKYFKSVILPKHPGLPKESERILESWDAGHFLPVFASSLLKQALINHKLE